MRRVYGITLLLHIHYVPPLPVGWRKWPSAETLCVKITDPEGVEYLTDGKTLYPWIRRANGSAFIDTANTKPFPGVSK